MADGGKPLPSGGASEEEAQAWEAEAQGAGGEEEGEPETTTTTETLPAAAPARPPAPRPTFKISTFLYVFLGLIGLWMLIDTAARNAIACALGTYPSSIPPPNGNCSYTGGPLYTLLGFNSNYLLVTMALVGAIEMLITAFAYNYTTDWVKQARVQKWSAAFRKVQMEAIRSGKKDRIAALKPHQERLTRLSGEISIAQFKGMAITYFLLILFYTWVGLVIGAATAAQQTVSLGGTIINLNGHIGTLPIPWWFVIFSLYTVPTSMIFRRVLKHLWLRRYAKSHDLPPVSGAAGSSA
jgi:uncharacterized membrane protein (DUF106 family)